METAMPKNADASKERDEVTKQKRPKSRKKKKILQGMKKVYKKPVDRSSPSLHIITSEYML